MLSNNIRTVLVCGGAKTIIYQGKLSTMIQTLVETNEVKGIVQFSFRKHPVTFNVLWLNGSLWCTLFICVPHSLTLTLTKTARGLCSNLADIKQFIFLKYSACHLILTAVLYRSCIIIMNFIIIICFGNCLYLSHILQLCSNVQ